MHEKADGAINFTASHNPPEYNGIKFSTPDGAPALPEVTQKIEAEIAAGETANRRPQIQSEPSKGLDPSRHISRALRETIDVKAIQKAGLRVAFDPLWGAARGYSDKLLREAGVNVATVHDYRDVLFGGHAPEPDDHLLEALREKMREQNAHIGIATDGDADRFGIVDEDGTFLQPNYIIALLFDYLVESRGWKNGVGQVGRHHQSRQCAGQTSQASNCMRPRWASNTLASSSSRTRSRSAAKKAPGCPFAITFPRKTASLPGLLCCEMVAPRKNHLGSNCTNYLPKLVPFTPTGELPLDARGQREVH